MTFTVGILRCIHRAIYSVPRSVHNIPSQTAVTGDMVLTFMRTSVCTNAIMKDYVPRSFLDQVTSSYQRRTLNRRSSIITCGRKISTLALRSHIIYYRTYHRTNRPPKFSSNKVRFLCSCDTSALC